MLKKKITHWSPHLALFTTKRSNNIMPATNTKQGDLMSRLREQCIRHLILSMFLAVLGLAGIAQFIGITFQQVIVTNNKNIHMFMALGNATFMGIMIGTLKLLAHRRAPVLPEHKFIPPLWLGVTCGFFLPYLAMNTLMISIATLLIIAIVWINLKRVSKSVIRMLAPNAYITWRDVVELAHVYLMLITAYTLTNACLELLHRMLERPTPFGFTTGHGGLVDSLYFSLVVMTTLGFGDIAPKTLSAKLLVGLECFTSYVVFTLLVGIMTRGVLPPDAPGKKN